MSATTTKTAAVGSRAIRTRAGADSGGMDSRIFGWGCAVIAIHILIDAYVGLRPGTSPADHLISGTVPVIALAALAMVFRRVRAGLGALISIQLGAAASIGATAPVMLLIEDGLVGFGSVSGAVAMMAGIVLIGSGFAMLWRYGRPPGGRIGRWPGRIGWSVSCLVLLNLISVPIGFAFIQANQSVGYALDEVELGPEYERVELVTADGLTLAAAYRPSTNGAAVIQFPGRRPAHEEMLAGRGYGVFVLEPRGRNDSEGDPPFVWNGEHDLKAAVRYLQSRPDVDDGRIGGIGLSHGGLLMIQTAAGEPGLRAIVSDGGTRRTVRDHYDFQTVTFPPFSPMATAAMAVFSDSLPPAPIPELIAEIAPRPIMLIWSGAEGDVEWVNTHHYQRAGEPKTIWHIPEAGHTTGLDARPEEYERRVMDFFDDALLPAGP